MSRNAITELLHAGLSDRAIGRQLNAPVRAVAALRRELNLPRAKSGPRPSTVEDRFWRRAVPTDDGHLLWPAITIHGADLRHDDGHTESVHRIAFRIGNRREAEGLVRTGCGTTGCIHPRHVEDAAMRQQYAAIFGEAA